MDKFKKKNSLENYWKLMKNYWQIIYISTLQFNSVWFKQYIALILVFL